ncbi:MAG: AAA family ATPase [Candidatus Brocadiaceae bacterium]
MVENNGVSVLLELKSKDILDTIKEILTSLDGFNVYDSVTQLKNQEHYDLLILETGDDPKRDLQYAHTLLTAETVRNIFLTSSNKNADILIDALRIGVKEFFPQPLKKEEVQGALLKVKSYKESQKGAEPTIKKGKIVNVFGTKGGVGTTTVAINLAVSLAEAEGSPSVVLIDLKPIFGEISVNLNIEPFFSWLEVIKNISRLDSTYLMSILSRHSSGVYILPSPIEFTEDYAAYPQALATLLKLMQTMFDYIIIDSGQSMDGNSRVIMKIADKMLLVFVLNLPCIINLKRLLNTFRKQTYPGEEKIEIIANRVHKNTDLTLKDAEESLQKKILCGIPNVFKLSMSAINEGKPLYSLAQGTEIWGKFRELTSTLFKANGGIQQKRKSFLPFAKSLFS